MIVTNQPLNHIDDVLNDSAFPKSVITVTIPYIVSYNLCLSTVTTSYIYIISYSPRTRKKMSVKVTLPYVISYNLSVKVTLPYVISYNPSLCKR